MKRAFAFLPALFCVGCVGAYHWPTDSLDALADPASKTAKSGRKSDAPTVELPWTAASVAGVSRRWQVNGFTERIRLATDTGKPDSRVDLTVRTSTSRQPVDSLSSRASDAVVHAELAREFPGLHMRIAPAGYYRNAYGDFGLAIGRSGDTLRCIYVWQDIEDARASGGLEAASSVSPAPASLRIKLCRTDMTIDELADAASRIEIRLPEDPGVGGPSVAASDEPAPARLDGGKWTYGDAAPAYPGAAPVPGFVASGTLYGSGYGQTASAASAEGQRFLASPAASINAANAGPRSTTYSQGVAATNLPPEAFAGPQNEMQH